MSSEARIGQQKRASIVRWVLLALVIHAEIGGVVGIALYFWAPRQAELEAKRREAMARGEPISVSTVDDSTARRIIADLERQEEKAKLAEAKKEEEAVHAPGQVVDLPRPREERRPDEARFAAEYDSWVEKETRRYGKFDPNAQQRHRGPSDTNKRNQPALTPNPSEIPAAPGPLAMRMPAEEKRNALARSRAGEPSPQHEIPGSDEKLPSDPDGVFSRKGTGGARPAPRRNRS